MKMISVFITLYFLPFILNYPLLLQCGQVRALAYRQPGEKHRPQELFNMEEKKKKREK